MKKYFAFFIIVLSPCVYAQLQTVPFPKTYMDTTLAQRINNASTGYKPFMEKQAYTELNIVPGEEIYTDHMIAMQEDFIAEHPETDHPEEKTPEPAPAAESTQTQPEPKTAQPAPKKPEQKPDQSGTFAGQTIGGGIVLENNQVIGGSCYPAARDRVFTNQILTTGRYESKYPAFEKALITIFRKEGRCGTIKNDPCGYTCYGIGSSPKCAGVVINSRLEAEDFYYERYWQKYKLYKLPDVISTDIMIACMASGPGSALGQFRKFLGLKNKTSAVDDEMVDAVKKYNGDIHNNWMDVRDTFLQSVAANRYKGDPRIHRAYKNAIEIKRNNGCHVRPAEPLYR